jgi:hypothetical protein
MSEKLIFEKLDAVVKGMMGNFVSWRSKVPGGWLFVIKEGPTVTTTFVPDPEHKWNGGSLS